MKIEYLWNSIVFILSYLKSSSVGGFFHFLQFALLEGSIADGQGQVQSIANRR
jgi:hypothetical protein